MLPLAAKLQITFQTHARAHAHEQEHMQHDTYLVWDVVHRVLGPVPEPGRRHSPIPKRTAERQEAHTRSKAFPLVISVPSPH